MDKIRIAVIGCGSLANAVHYPSLAEMEDVELCSICDLSEERLCSTAERFHVENIYTDYRKMIDEEEPDGVFILMPPHHLYDLVIQCLNRRRNVFIEKPPGVTAEQTRNMARAAERNGCLSMVGFNRRFIPLMDEARNRIEAHGPIIQCVATFYKNTVGAGPYYDGAIDILTCDAIHAVDMLRWVGGEVRSVASDVRSLHADYHNSFNALMSFESGATGVLLTNWVVGKRVHTFEMHAKGMSAFINPDVSATLYLNNDNEGKTITTQQAAESDKQYCYYGFYHEDRYFVDCIREGHEPQTHFGDAAKTMELVERIYRGQI
ncbi:MAG: Gfo/Idh/MocA family oxidoreductase [Armatimonadetes bacterium]|nr:Gfo/Idh/MocA family oxidoreductase [Armatimonadota bacterium]